MRVRRSSDYRRVQKLGRKLRTRHLLIAYVARRSGESRYGLTVSRKVGKAVARNQVKRWLREAIRKHQGELTRALDVVFIASPRASGAGLVALESEVVEAFRRLSQGEGR